MAIRVEMLETYASPETILLQGKVYNVSDALGGLLIEGKAARKVTSEELKKADKPVQVMKQPKPDPEDKLDGDSRNAKKNELTPDETDDEDDDK